MKWPLESRAASRMETPFFNLLYLHAPGRGGPDPTIVWVSELPWEPLQDFLGQANRSAPVMLGTTHLLVQAVGQALAIHPEFNRRVVGRKVHAFKGTNVCLATRIPGNDEVNLVLIKDAGQKRLLEIAETIWHNQLAYRREKEPVIRDRDRLRRLPAWFFRYTLRAFHAIEHFWPMPIFGRVDRFRSSPVLVNDFSQKRFPAMRAYKPSRMPDESKSMSVTLGPREEKVIWRDGQPQPVQVAPLCVRADHRVCDGFQLSQFVSTLIELLSAPEKMRKAHVVNPPAIDAPHATARKTA
ncbi:MAG: 2-oxo acid dehydrogenase subunit E2 [Mariniblastus sp.]|nr:2-oxo acid dehydrogenase subunit E2 [Mariniblastus sp.]